MLWIPVYVYFVLYMNIIFTKLISSAKSIFDIYNIYSNEVNNIWEPKSSCLCTEHHHIINSSGQSQNAFNPAFMIAAKTTRETLPEENREDLIIELM